MDADEAHFRVDRSEAPFDVVLRAAHRFSGRFAVSVLPDEEGSVVRLSGPIESLVGVERAFRAHVLDDVLRDRIERETAPLRRMIIEAALRSALREPDAPT